MKQLQNNFTTPEQSERLLELGLPADSADCYYGSYGGHPDYVAVRQTEFETEDDALFRLNDNLLPCWSVGRLIEIYFICSFQPEILIDYTIEDLIDYLVSLFKSYAMNFSKLEEKL